MTDSNVVGASAVEETVAAPGHGWAGLLIPIFIVVASSGIAGLVVHNHLRHAVELSERIRVENRLKMASVREHVEEYLAGVYSTLLYVGLNHQVVAMSTDSREYIQAIFDREWDRHRLSELYIIKRDFDGSHRPFMAFERGSEKHSTDVVHSLEREEEEYRIQSEHIRRFAAEPTLAAQISDETHLCVEAPDGSRDFGVVYSVPIRSGSELIGIVAAMVPTRRIEAELGRGHQQEAAILISDRGAMLGCQYVADDTRAWFEEQFRQGSVAGFFAALPETFQVGKRTALWTPVDITSEQRWWLTFCYGEAAYPSRSGLGAFLNGWGSAGGIVLTGILLALLVRAAHARLAAAIALVAERGRAQKALRESETRSRTLLEGSPVCYKIIDLDSRLQYMSAAGLKTLKIPDIKPFYGCTYPPDFYPESMRTPLIEHLERAKAGEISSVECPVLDTEGCEVWYHTTFVPARDDEGRIMYVIASSVDITQRKRAEEEAREAQQRLLEQQRSETEHVQAQLEKARGQLVTQTRLASIGQVAGSIAHDLRNPLGSARNAIFYLKRYVPGADPDLIEHLDIINEEINAADGIISDLMNMTRSKPLVRQRLDFGEVVQSAVQRAKLADGICCRVTLDPDPFTLDADPGQLSQVVQNLLSNAAQALNGQGQITVEAKRGKDCSEIEIRDNGCGVAAEHRDQLFEPLFTTKAKGTGLGLTICREIIERHGGSIELVDRGEPGATFRVRLPR